MTIYIEGENFMRARRFSIAINRITTLQGPNGQGKSSIALAVAKTASRDLFDTKAECASQVTTGAQMGEVTLKVDDNKIATFNLPDNTIQAHDGLHDDWSISKVAAGTLRLAEMSKKADRFALLQEFLNAEPTRDDLAAELTKIGMTEDGITRIWKQVVNPVSKKPDWVKAHKTFEDQRKAQKAIFKDVTGIQWGSDQGPKWLPDGYDRELENESEESLRGQLASLELERDAALKNEALDDATRDRYERQVEAVPEFEEKEKTAEEKRRELSVKLEAARADHAKLPKPEKKPETWPCWNCGEENAVESNKGVKPKDVSDDEMAARAEAIAKSAEEGQAISRELESIQGDLRVIRENIKAGVEAEEKLKAKSAADNKSVDVEKARNAVVKAQERLDAFKRLVKARDLNSQILQSDKLVALTAPDGLPGQKLAAAIDTLNEDLKELCDVAEWGRVKVNSKDGSVSYNGFTCSAYAPSTAEKAICNATIQAALARIKGDKLLVMDGYLEPMTNTTRSSLFWMLEAVEIPTLITRSVDEDECQDLDAYGESYWVQEGMTEPLEFNEDDAGAEEEVEAEEVLEPA